MLFIPADRKARAAALGLAGVLVLYLCLALAHTFMLRIYKPGDERRHTKYAVVLDKEGRLPTMKETLAANHPPLYYAVVAKTVLKGATSTRGIDDQVRRGRYLSVACGAIALVYAFLIIRLLLPKHPAVAVHGTAVMAVIPSYANNCAVLANDAASLAAQFAMIHGALVILLRGPTWRRCLLLAVILSLVGLTRLSGVLVIPVALLAVAAGAWWHLGGSARRRAALALLLTAALAGSVAVTSGWFYARNAAASGDPTGQAAILDRRQYHPVKPPLEVALDRDKWLELHDETWGRLAGLVHVEGGLKKLARWLTGLSLVGALVALGRARVWEHGRHLWRRPQAFAWVVMAGVWASVFLPAFVYHARGGGLHQRYIFGALYIATLGLALGVAWTRAKLVAILGLAAALVLSLSIHVTYGALIVRRVVTFPIEQALTNGLKADANAGALALMVGLTFGVAAVMAAVTRLHRPLYDPS